MHHDLKSLSLVCPSHLHLDQYHFTNGVASLGFFANCPAWEPGTCLWTLLSSRDWHW